MTDQTAATECAFADEGCTCGRPRLTLTEAQARMAAAPKPGPTFATYLDRHDRDQLDARAATAEQERDEALDARNVLRQQLDQARAELATEHRERTESEAWGRQLRTELTKAQNERNTALRTIAAIRDAASPPSSVPPRRAQEVRGERGPEIPAEQLPAGATVQPEPSSCPETIWDGPYRMRCGKGAIGGVCSTHGRFRPEREG